MPDLSFEILSASPAPDMLMPVLAFEVRITNPFPEQFIEAVLLRCQIRIEVARRRYTSDEQARLHDLFDDPVRWGDTLRPITWAVISVNLPAFSGAAVNTIHVPCTFDLTVATAKYFHGLEAGEIPLAFLFSGTVFFHGASGALQVAPISWDKEARFRLPVQTWKELMNLHYPNTAVLHLRRDVLDDLYRFKVTGGFATFEETIQRMLAMAGRERPAS